jgi:hypothetical protein
MSLGGAQHHWRHFEAKHLGGLKVNDPLAICHNILSTSSILRKLLADLSDKMGLMTRQLRNNPIS